MGIMLLFRMRWQFGSPQILTKCRQNLLAWLLAPADQAHALRLHICLGHVFEIDLICKTSDFNRSNGPCRNSKHNIYIYMCVYI